MTIMPATYYDLLDKDDEERSRPVVHKNEDGQILVNLYPQDGFPPVFLVMGPKRAKELSKKLAELAQEEINDRESESFEEAEKRLEECRVRSGAAMSRSPTGYSCDFHDGFNAALGVLYARRPR